jgi:hypothetical protein
MKGALLLDVVIRKSPSILKLFPGKDETLLIRRDPAIDGQNRVEGKIT